MSDFYYMYIGSYVVVPGRSDCGKGISCFRISKKDFSTEKLFTLKTLNPSFIEIDTDAYLLFAVEETAHGKLHSFKINPDTKHLTKISTVSTHGKDPCFINLNKSDNFIQTANYSSGSIVIHQYNNKGMLSDSFYKCSYSGSSLIKNRQESPHAHSLKMFPGSKNFIVQDLGCDKLWIHRNLQSVNNKITTEFHPDISYVKVTPGNGPRHIAFHPTISNAYIINELSASIDVLKYNIDINEYNIIQSIFTLPKKHLKEENSAADIHIHPNGKFLYVSNRGCNKLTIFSIDNSTGLLHLLKIFTLTGNNPRNFNIHYNGQFLTIAYQDSNTVDIFTLNQKTGLLENHLAAININAPVCIKYL